jgi:hypothetical protein
MHCRIVSELFFKAKGKNRIVGELAYIAPTQTPCSISTISLLALIACLCFILAYIFGGLESNIAVHIIIAGEKIKDCPQIRRRPGIIYTIDKCVIAGMTQIFITRKRSGNHQSKRKKQGGDNPQA